MNEPETDQAISTHGQMQECPKCGRKAPSDRLDCLYCGAALELSDEQKMAARTVLRKIEIWEPGWNIVVTSAAGDRASAAAEILRLEIDDAEVLFGSAPPFPAARTASTAEAELVVKKLAAKGMEAVVLSDEELAPQEPPGRLRAVEFLESNLRPVLFNEPDSMVAPVEPVLVVEGFLNRKRLDTTEKRSRGQEKIFDSAETGSDERVIDIYPAGDRRGFRIRQEGFDFSCLGDSKAFTAAENISKVLTELCERFTEAVHCRTYRDVRRALGIVWPQTEKVSSEGVERQSFRGYAQKKVVVTDNEDQFTRFSRMMWSLLGNRS